jgi:hypothetical protein
MSKLNKHNRFHMERLEDRQMMAGDLHAFFNNGTLFITEASGHVGGHQAVEISRTPTGKIRIEGATSPANPTGSLINGKPFIEFANSNLIGPPIEVSLGTGQDQVFVKGSNSFFLGSLKINTANPLDNPNDADTVVVLNTKIAGKVEINTGAGNDIVRVLNSQLSSLDVKAGVTNPAGTSDVDTVLVKGSKVTNNLTITTGESNDQITIKGTDVGQISHTNLSHITVNAGAGADTVKIGSLVDDIPGSDIFGPVTATGGIHVIGGTDLQNDVDTVLMQDVFVDNHIVVELGNGSDRLNMVNALAGTNISLAGQKGNDLMTITEVEASDGFFAFLGEGDDTLDMTYVKANRMELDGGAGLNDNLRRSQMPFISNLTVRNWELLNGRRTLAGSVLTNIDAQKLPQLTLR